MTSSVAVSSALLAAGFQSGVTPWRSETWTTLVCRPNLTSLTINSAGPTCVRRRKFRARVMVSGWFCGERVVEKCSAETERKRLVRKPPWGTVPMENCWGRRAE